MMFAGEVDMQPVMIGQLLYWGRNTGQGQLWVNICVIFLFVLISFWLWRVTNGFVILTSKQARNEWVPEFRLHPL